ncbi:alpha/beta fold hydrolase [Pseudodesulfovibrio sp. zrk46]|uniref:alpha/beta fold hydrolase n=1 Tax=Pseudodesulfovibrio sp. zrk46 TaxID=2725288 RepID=UPI00144976FE|nr:alpha/beta fold hydrolase [Pseudodesulfovibrio sp. zrk46]QJB56501.1 alpha/beta hydrolase [Pseudodesulfovibrio sp. zrk46]
MRILLVLLCVFTAFAGCTKSASVKTLPTADTRFNLMTERLDTSDIFHYMVIKPDYFQLDFPSFFIGVEKARKKVVGEPTFGTCPDPSAPCLKTGSDKYNDKPDVARWIERLFGHGWDLTKDFKSHLPTHAASYDGQAGNAKLIYNVYGTQCAHKETAPPYTNYDLYNQGWSFILSLKKQLRDKIESEQATHVFFFSMGWNTPQWEALANFTAFYNHIKTKAEQEGYFGNSFRPVVVCMTWPSFWPDKRGLIGSASDYPTMVDDADELGASIANLIVQDVIGSIKKEQQAMGKDPISIVLVGHSLGALLVTRAADSGYLVTDNPAKIDLVVGLEGAFSAKRFLNKNQAWHLWFFPEIVEHSYYTSSQYDWATDGPSKFFNKYYIGAYRTFAAVESGTMKEDLSLPKKGWILPKDKFNTTTLEKNGIPITGLPVCNKVTLVDASKITFRNVPGTGGGAHSDIYSPEMGAFIWEAVKKCTIDTP